jgi:DNA polymerase
MSQQPPRDASALVPEQLSLESLRDAAARCDACDLHLTGTQTVFGAGQREADVMFIGEQPGDKEDLEGKPFIGPAGRLLDRALVEAGIDRDEVYVTNTVKHFKWRPAGKRRIHEKPNPVEIAACRPWLDAELEVVNPKVVVCLGSTAAQAMLGRQFRVTRQRGEFMRLERGGVITATIHPSAILRAPDEVSREHEFQGFVADLRKVADEMRSLRDP